MIGYAQYHCLCVQYALPDYTVMIIAISIAVALLLIFLIILGSTLYGLHRRRRAGELAKEEMPKKDSNPSLEDKEKNDDSYMNSDELYKKNDSTYLQVDETVSTSL